MRFLPFFRKLFPLPHTEPVLLVRHHQRQRLILYLPLNQGMSTDNQVSLSGSDFTICFPFFLSRHGTHQQYRFECEMHLLRIFADGFKMLGGQHFRRRHHGSLIAVCRGHQQGKQSKHRFSGSDVPLNQAVHTVWAAQIIPDLPPHSLLCLCQGKRKLLNEAYRIGSLKHGMAVFHPVAEFLVLPHQK